MKELLSNPRFYVAVLFVSASTVCMVSGVIENRREPRRFANILNWISLLAAVIIIGIYTLGALAGLWKW